MPRLSRLAWCVIACVLGAATVAQSGETLYNGIVLPDDWPPKLENVHVDPVTPCYLQVPPAVIPIDVGRQLFVDDFLIDSTTLQRGLHQAEYYPGNPLQDASPYSGGMWFDPADKTLKMWLGGTMIALPVRPSRRARRRRAWEAGVCVPAKALRPCGGSCSWADASKADR